jgi:hypothetical protein
MLLFVGVPAAIAGLFAIVGILKSCEDNEGKPSSGSAPTSVSKKADISGPWKGPAEWVATLRSVLKKPKSLRAVDTIRRDGITSIIYDLAPHESDSAGTLERVDGKLLAWRWTIVSPKVVLSDLASADQMEQLFENSPTTWYRLISGEFQGDYASFLPPSKPGDTAILQLRTPVFAQDQNESGLQPWLCSHGRVEGTTPLEKMDMITECRTLARKSLKAPSTAEFPGLLDTESPLWYGNCDMVWKSWVEGKNAFGVPMRSEFTCSYNSRTTDLRLKFHR